MELEITNALNKCSQELYTLVVQYGSACLLSNKEAAISINSHIQECFKTLDAVILLVAKLEKEQHTHQDILAALEE
jgi:vesicle coat complex subunit